MADMPEYTLAEFESWCEGNGRNGPNAGRHYHALEAVDRFRQYRQNQSELVAECLSDAAFDDHAGPVP